MIGLAVILASLFAYWFYVKTRKPKGFPPGPKRWPIVGSIPYLSNKHSNFLLGLRGLVEEYGPVVGYYIGNRPIVLIADYALLKNITKLVKYKN